MKRLLQKNTLDEKLKQAINDELEKMGEFP